MCRSDHRREKKRSDRRIANTNRTWKKQPSLRLRLMVSGSVAKARRAVMAIHKIMLDHLSNVMRTGTRRSFCLAASNAPNAVGIDAIR